MTAFVVTIAALSAAEAAAGTPIIVPLSVTGESPATHYGCNWANRPAETLLSLSELDGVAIGESWVDLCAELGLQRVASETEE